mmetsp:Transcript_3031/g.4355  ORF Transcript_3031/g.4355 Transcript_3031/m.4355 type:complete len:110 (+) Transcript_3031:2158-2487(+)
MIHLHHGHGRSKGTHKRHLQNDVKGITHMINIKLLECIGAVSAHEQNSLSQCRAGELLEERADLSGKNEGGTFGEISWLLQSRVLPCLRRRKTNVQVEMTVVVSTMKDC